MNFYKLARRFFKIKSPRLKILALAAAYTARRRCIGVFLDPVMTCNLRCKMCYFSDDKARPEPCKPITNERIDKIRTALLPKTLKLQIGCGAEPTLYTHLPELIKEAKDTKVPYVEITTNGQLLDYERLKRMIEAGLDGITLSMHGTRKETYEYLMGNARFEKLQILIQAMKRIKTEHSGFKLRINYTFNNMNIAELKDIWGLWDGVPIDVLQIRPIQKLGDTAYSDFNLSDIYDRYDELINPVQAECQRRGVLFIGPAREHLKAVDKTHSIYDQAIEDFTYCYVSPASCYQPDFDIDTDTFVSYHKRKHTLRYMLKLALSPETTKQTEVKATKKMNYDVK